MALLEEKIFTLSSPIVYSSKGDSIEATFVKLLPPTSKSVRQCAVIKQLFFRAATSVRKDNIGDVGSVEKEEKDSDDDDDDDGFFDVFYISETTEIEPVIDAFRKLFKTGVLLIDGEIKATDPLLDKIVLEDFEKICSLYLGNYIAASMLLNSGKKD